MKDPNIVCQPGGLGRSPRHLVGAGVLDTGGILSPNEHFGTLDNLVVPTMLDLPNERSSNLDSVGQCHGSGVYINFREEPEVL